MNNAASTTWHVCSFAKRKCEGAESETFLRHNANGELANIVVVGLQYVRRIVFRYMAWEPDIQFQSREYRYAPQADAEGEW